MNCSYCGVELTPAGDGKYLCPNCGVLKEQREINEDDEDRSYVG